MNKEAEQYYELIIKFLTGNTFPEENALLNEWKNISEDNERFFNQTRDVWLASAQVKQQTQFDSQAALNIVLSKISHPVDNVHPNKVKTMIPFVKVMKIAAVLVLTFFLGGVTTRFLNLDSTTAENIIKFVAPKGARSIAYLPDGTVVWLNAGSQIEYNLKDHSKFRKVTLVGEAFFKVKANKLRPFIVYAKGLSIKALGTSFNVKAYAEEKEITTTLVEGIVKVEGKADAKNKPFIITMHPNQKVVYYVDSAFYVKEALKKKTETQDETHTEKTVPILSQQFIPATCAENINTMLYTSWKDDRWIIEGQEFGDLATLLERRFNIKITFMSDELKRYRFSGTFTNEPVEQALSYMRYIIPFSYDINKGNVVVKLDEALKKKYNSAYIK